MKKGIYVIRDTVADAMVGGVTLFSHDAAAVRAFSDVQADSNAISKHFADHELVKVGTLDDETLVVTPMPQVVVVTGVQMLASQEAARARPDNN